MKLQGPFFFYWFVTFKFININDFSLVPFVDIMVTESSQDYKLINSSKVEKLFQCCFHNDSNDYDNNGIMVSRQEIDRQTWEIMGR